MLSQAPHGLDDIIATFGDIDAPHFEDQHIVSITFPYPLVYDGKTAPHGRCHRLAVDNFIFALERCRSRGFQIQNYGGIYCRRPIGGQPSHASTHSWGIAIDIDPKEYPRDSTKRLPDPVIESFRDAGFTYGGNFRSRLDPMHFQLATAY